MRLRTWGIVVAAAVGTSCAARIGGPSKSGVVGVSSAAYTEAGAARFAASAGAAFSASAAVPAACARAEVTPRCAVLACKLAPDDAGDASPPSAGTITLRVGARAITLAPTADHTYGAYEDSSAALWAAGDVLSIAASGGEVPAFSGEVTAPDVATVTSPVLPPDGARFALARAADVAFGWTPPAAGARGATVEVTLSGASPSADRAVATCSFDAASGAGAVPSAALAAIALGDASLSVTTRASRTIDAGDWAIALNADTQSRTPDGRRFVAIVNLQ